MIEYKCPWCKYEWKEKEGDELPISCPARDCNLDAANIFLKSESEKIGDLLVVPAR